MQSYGATNSRTSMKNQHNIMGTTIVVLSSLNKTGTMMRTSILRTTTWCINAPGTGWVQGPRTRTTGAPPQSRAYAASPPPYRR